MNHDDPNYRRPPRAGPLQPDRPGRGMKKDQDKARDGSPGTDPKSESSGDADKLKEQSDVAIENVREGYGG